MKTIMVATDGSAGAERAVDFAARLAHDLGAELVLTSVVGEFPAEQMRALGRAEADIGSVMDSAAERIVAAAAARVVGQGITNIRRCTLWGGPAEAILAECNREVVDAVVVGRRGRSRLEGLVLGSTSQKLVSLAKCPVIVVP